MQKLFAILLFAVSIFSAVLAGFASKSSQAMDLETLTAASQNPGLFELGVLAAVCLLAAGGRWKTTDKS